MTVAVGYLRTGTPVFDGLTDEWLREHPDWANEVRAMARLVRDPFASLSRFPARYLSTPGVIPGEIVGGVSVLEEGKTPVPVVGLVGRLITLGPAAAETERVEP